MIVFCVFPMKKVGTLMIVFHVVIKAVMEELENVATSRERLAEVPPAETGATSFSVELVYPGKVLLEWLIWKGCQESRRFWHVDRVPLQPLWWEEDRVCYSDMWMSNWARGLTEAKVQDLDFAKPGNNFLVLTNSNPDEIFTFQTYQLQYILLFKITFKSECTSATL